MQIDPSRSTSRMASAAAIPPAELPMRTYLGKGLLLGKDEGLVGAVGYAGRYRQVRAEVTLGNDAPLVVGDNSPIGAEEDTSPAADAFFLLKDHRPRLGVLLQGPSKTGKDTGGFLAVAARQGKAHHPVDLDLEPGQGSGRFLLVGPNWIPGKRVLYLTVNL